MVLAACVTLVVSPLSGAGHGAEIAALLLCVAYSGVSSSLSARLTGWLLLPLLAASLLFVAFLPALPLLAYDVARLTCQKQPPPGAGAGIGHGAGHGAGAGIGVGALAGVAGVVLAGAVGLVLVLARWVLPAFAAAIRGAGGADGVDLVGGADLVGVAGPSPLAAAAVLTAAALAALLAWRTVEAEGAMEQVYRVRDVLQAKVVSLRDSNARLQEAQDYQTRAGVLAERTRIAREIHDGVGHRLTGLLFRVRALEVLHRADGEVVAHLGELAAGLDESMSAMRASVHALSDEAEDLPTALHVLAGQCGIEQVRVECESAGDIPARVSRCFVAVTREGLTNALKHGKATNASVRVSEYPGFWRLQVFNNGVLAYMSETEWAQHLATTDGMGLRSMRDRVEAVGGTLRVETNPQFCLFAMIPKEALCE